MSLRRQAEFGSRGAAGLRGDMSRIKNRIAVAAILWALLAANWPSSLCGAPVATGAAVNDEEVKYQEIKDAAAKFSSGDIQQALEMLEIAQMRHPELPPP